MAGVARVRFCQVGSRGSDVPALQPLSCIHFTARLPQATNALLARRLALFALVGIPSACIGALREALRPAPWSMAQRSWPMWAMHCFSCNPSQQKPLSSIGGGLRNEVHVLASVPGTRWHRGLCHTACVTAHLLTPVSESDDERTAPAR